MSDSLTLVSEKRLRELLAENEQLRTHNVHTEQERDEARAEAARLRQALEFYAQEAFYTMSSFYKLEPVRLVGEEPVNVRVQGSPIMHDHGQRARDALAGRGGSREGA